ncbi:MAG TPA: metalloprotease PmbA [Steroidobacteraceae bacterium]|jgi:PmbA protein|nr:metalloprotease PmbA [Steroidobacteraceae bacterium]
MAIEPSSAPVADGADLLALVELALEEARVLGASQAEAAVSMDVGLSVSVRLGEVETVEYQRDRGMGVTVYFGTRKGSASTADLSPAMLRETVAKACSIARFTAEDPCAGLADSDTLATEIPDLDLAHPWDVTPERACEMALECEAAAMAVDARITNSEGAGVSTHRGVRAYGNSLGFLAAYPGTVHSLSCAVLGASGEEMERDYWYSTARDWRALESAASVGRASGERAVRRLGARQLGTMKVPVLFAPDVARGLVGHFVGAVRGGSQYRRASFLLDAAGQQVFPDWFAISERPHLPRALASAPFDHEGVATRDRELVSAGVLLGYVLGTYSARKLGLRTTGNAGGTHNLLVHGRGRDFAGMLALMDRGLLVTELMGQGVNGVTGDYSRGAAGFWVENGVLVHPVHEVTVAGNLRDIYRQIAEVGSDVDARGGIRTGSILVEQMTVAGA